MFNYTFSIAFSPAFDGVINLPLPIPIDIGGITDPVIGQVVISDVSGLELLVTAVYRYNGQKRWACGVTDHATNLICGTMDVYFSIENQRWQAKEYIPIRYRDEEGVRLGL